MVISSQADKEQVDDLQSNNPVESRQMVEIIQAVK